MTTLRDGTGKPLVLGPKIGAGGEGSIFDLPGTGLVVKIYHGAPQVARHDKLIAQIAAYHDDLGRVAAWPLATVHQKRKAPACGFVMRRVTKPYPIHHLYNPSQRKQRFPDASWAFLLHVARNVAAAFDCIHARGHVIGDVNQGNLLVARDGKVTLIDCDSFQIASNGKVFPCEVGVAHFTPPELQGRRLSGLVRTPAHDRFGLAVLIFHLLMMGRHPYAGVYGGDCEMPLERAIADHRYAYGTQAARLQMEPPPHSLSIEVLPAALRDLFEQAFAPDGERPDARAWIKALEDLQGRLTRCQDVATHTFPVELAFCPWCAAERTSGVVWFTGALRAAGEAFDLHDVWARILAEPRPQLQSLPSPPPCLSEPRVAGILGGLLGILARVLPAKWHLVAWCRLVDTHRRALRHARSLHDKRPGSSAIADFDYVRSELERSYKEYQGLVCSKAAQARQIRQQARKHQLRRYLSLWPIADASIPGIGASRKAKLTSFGIHTAADISGMALEHVRGLGPTLTRVLLDWRSDIERKFAFNAAHDRLRHQLAALEAKYAQRCRILEQRLIAGPSQLAAARRGIEEAQVRFNVELIAAYREVEATRVAIDSFRILPAGWQWLRRLSSLRWSR